MYEIRKEMENQIFNAPQLTPKGSEHSSKTLVKKSEQRLFVSA
jgi:hypothetical protein